MLSSQMAVLVPRKPTCTLPRRRAYAHHGTMPQIEAIPTIIMAFVILLFLPSFPFSTTFLTPREKAIAQARLNRDHRPQSHGGMTGWQGFKAVVNDPHSWALMTVYASCE